ncbi:MAG: MFS transporter [Alphaproteobacteria bacterium]
MEQVGVTPSSLSAARFPTSSHLFVSALWLAFYAQWQTVVPIVMPDQIAGIVGPDNPAKEGISGSVIAAGAAIALVVAPLAGALSDRRRSPRGRRRSYLVTGTVGTCLALVILAALGTTSSIWFYALAVLNLQFWWNWATGPYAGLIPDVVPPADQPVASGWLNIMAVIGTILGNVLMVVLYSPGQPLPVVAAFVALSLVLLAATVFGVREPPAIGDGQPFELGPFLRSFYLDPKEHRNFYWVLVTRLFANLGVWAVFTFLLFYVQSVIGMDREAAARLVPALLGAGAVLAIPASLIGVRLANRHGIVCLVRITSWLMAAAAIGYALIAFSPHIALVIPLVLVFSAAYGAYCAVDWALALRVLPAGKDAAKDMGIWHICMVLPQMIGPAAIGWLISGLRTVTSSSVAYAAAFALAALWFALAAALVNRVRLAPPS